MQHKTQALLDPGQFVTIRKHRRKVGGEHASVHDIFWREEEPWVVLQLPSGRRTAVPASWTDLPRELLSSTRSRAEIHPLALVELAKHCRSLRRLSRRVTSNTRTKRKKK
jgi:hypothetical protein